MSNLESHLENMPEFKIELPELGDEDELAPMHIQAWKESYIIPGSALTEEKIDQMLSHMLSDTSFRKNTIAEALANQEKVLYRIVKNNNGNIVGFLHGSISEPFNELEAIYLLNEAKGTGVGDELMRIFLDWSHPSKPCRLEVFSLNERAINFYSKHGFVKTDKVLPLFRNILPATEMVRPVISDS